MDESTSTDGILTRIINKLKGRFLEYFVWSILLILWEAWGRGQSPYLFSYPSAIVKAAKLMIVDGELLVAVINSLQTLIVGYSLAAVAGVVLGLLAGRFNYIRRLFNPLLTAFFVTPRLALLPLIIIWFGIGFESKIVIVWLTSFFVIFFNIVHGIRSISGSHLDIAKAYGANDWQITREVILPASIPFVATGLRLGLGLALVGMVVSEFFIGISGLGGLIVIYSSRLEIAKVFVSSLAIIILGLILMGFAYVLERRLSHWRQTERAF